MNTYSRLVLTCFLLIFVASCALTSSKREPQPATPQEKALLDQVKEDMAQKRYQQALAKIDQIVKTSPDSDAVDDALMIKGKYYYELAQFKQAYTAFMGIIDSDIFSPNEAEALFLAANSLYKLGRFDEALALSQKSIKIDDIAKNLKLMNHKLSYTIQSQLGYKLDSFMSLIQMANLEKDPKKQRAYKLRVIEFTESQLSEKQLMTLLNEEEGFIQPYVSFQLATIKFEQKDFRRAREYYQDTVSMLPNSRLAEIAKERIEQIEARRKVSPQTIGAVLPLSGRHSNVAYRSLRGLQLGLGIYGKNRSNFELAVVDSEGNPDIARRAVERLVTEDHIIAIVGSLLSRTSVSVASKAEELGVPTIALSQKSGITQIGEGVFRNSITSSMQVQQLVRVAMNDLGLKKFAILYPNDAYGVEYANLFWDAVLARGGEIRGVQAYDPKASSYSPPIQRLVGTFFLEDREQEYKGLLRDWYKERKSLRSRQSPPEDLLPPMIDFEAIFVPDSASAMGQIAPTLAYHDITGVKLLGTNLWNTSKLIRLGKRHVDDAIFVDSILSTDENFRRSQFFKEYVAVFDEEPGLFEAQAYDAGLMIRQAVASGSNSRLGLARDLAQKTSFQGATGLLQMTRQREILRPLVTLTVHKNQITRVDKYPMEELFPKKESEKDGDQETATE
jgi:branched-chain amino acid transport system substrate-binding protein